jgi:hypothetical protein
MDNTSKYPDPFTAEPDRSWWTGRVREEWHRFYGPNVPRDGAGQELEVALRVAYADGRLIATGLLIETVDGSALTADDIRRVSLPTLLGVFGREQTRERNLVARKAPDGVVRRPGRRGHTDDYYRHVATVYEAALLEHPSRPMAATAGELGVHRSQARRLVATARDRGYLEVES